jgi:hypothetical protein
MRPVPPHVGDDRGAAMDLGHEAQIDGERELNLLALAQAEIFSLDEYAVRAQILRLADAALSSRHDDVHRSSRSVASVQATLHRYRPLRC